MTTMLEVEQKRELDIAIAKALGFHIFHGFGRSLLMATDKAGIWNQPLKEWQTDVTEALSLVSKIPSFRLQPLGEDWRAYFDEPNGNASTRHLAAEAISTAWLHYIAAAPAREDGGDHA